MHARMLITDSGGIQEETTYLGIPCLTLRDNTERPVTITQGTNTLCGIDSIEKQINEIMNGNYKKGGVPKMWDGCTAARVTESIAKKFNIGIG